MSTEGGTLYGQWKIIYDFATNDWSTIKQGVLSGTNPYKVGDTKTITLNGFGDHTVRVANVSECTNGETSETACGFVVEFADIITTHNMNSTNSCVGGYPASAMYSYLKNTILPAIPEEIKNVMINTKVISGHGSSESSNFTTTDKLYLLGAEEIWNNTSTYNSAASTSRQLDYYKNNGVTDHKSTSLYSVKNYNGTATKWWLRSPLSDGNYYFWRVNTNGTFVTGTYDDYASLIYGVSPAFRIG